MSGGTMMHAAPPSQNRSRLLAYAQLLRIPNVFTATADIALAAVVSNSLPAQFVPVLLLVLASSCLYCGGMVWNDYFDYVQDLKERPGRPLPSNRIALPTAARLGTLLLVGGVVLAGFGGVRDGAYYAESLIVAALLAGAILLYDIWLKRTVFGPIGMGLCRFLNVLLGLTVGGSVISPWGFVLALVVGIYIVGVTWFARREAGASKKLELVAAMLVMLTALPLALLLPALGKQLARGDGPTRIGAFMEGELGHVLFPYLLVAFGFWIGIPTAAAARNPTPQRVQTAVKRAVLGLIALDAVLATSLAGTPGLLILLLLPPALVLGRWVYST
jgi:UbiA prenyltransferase family